MSEEMIGIAPGFLLVPAREHRWEVKRNVEISVPKPPSDRLGEDGPFFITEEGVSSLWMVVPFLFGNNKYPELADDECFNLTALEEDEEKIVLYGQILKVL